MYVRRYRVWNSCKEARYAHKTSESRLGKEAKKTRKRHVALLTRYPVPQTPVETKQQTKEKNKNPGIP